MVICWECGLPFDWQCQRTPHFHPKVICVWVVCAWEYVVYGSRKACLDFPMRFSGASFFLTLLHPTHLDRVLQTYPNTCSPTSRSDLTRDPTEFHQVVLNTKKPHLVHQIPSKDLKSLGKWSAKAISCFWDLRSFPFDSFCIFIQPISSLGHSLQPPEKPWCDRPFWSEFGPETQNSSKDWWWQMSENDDLGRSGSVSYLPKQEASKTTMLHRPHRPSASLAPIAPASSPSAGL